MPPRQTETHYDTSQNVDCAARDEAAGLRSEICQLRMRIEELEDERSFAAAKQSELEEVLASFKKEDIHETLIKKSLQVAETTSAMEALSQKIKTMSQYEMKLKRVIVVERRQSKAQLEDLTAVVKSLQQSSSADDSHDEDEYEQKILTPQEALDMTLKNLKFHVEFLEDERQTMTVKCSHQDKRISQLEKDIEMKDVKIRMMEELIRNYDGKAETEESSASSDPTRARKESGRRSKLKTSNSAPDLFRASSSRRSRRGGPLKDASAVEERRQRRAKRNSGRSTGRELKISVNGKDGLYAGPVKDGKPHGVGTIRFENGESYLGEVQYGKLHGLGTLYSESGVTRGRFENNELLTTK